MEDSEKRGVFSKKKKDTFFPPMNIYKGICKPAQLEDIKCRAEFCVTNSQVIQGQGGRYSKR